MRWRGRRQSSNIDDRRGRRISKGVRRGGIGGIGTILIILGGLYFGVDPSFLLQALQGGGGGLPTYETAAPAELTPAQKERGQFAAVVLADTEDVWHRIFQQSGGRYEEPTLVLFAGAVESACGFSQSAMGPFYCPGDRQLYIDLAFFQELKERYRAPGDFAQAYVIAHEVAHHVQTLMGISKEVHAQRRQVSEVEANALSVRMELQADCLAGVWANRAEQASQVLERGDIEEALTAASAIGDDRLQKQAQGRVVPDSFTHGTSAQRMRWFTTGLESGDVARCDTFGASRL